MKIRISRKLTCAQSRIALDDVYFTLFGIAAAAVNEFLHTVCYVDAAGELLLHALAGLLRRLAAALIDEHLLGDLICLGLILNEIDLELFLEEIRHRFLNEAVGYRLFGLVFIRGLGREAVCDQHKAVGNILKVYLALVFLIFADLLYVSVDGINKGAASRLLGRSAVFKPR